MQLYIMIFLIRTYFIISCMITIPYERDTKKPKYIVREIRVTASLNKQPTDRAVVSPLALYRQAFSKLRKPRNESSFKCRLTDDNE